MNDLLERFCNKVEKIGFCWNWKEGKTSTGYGLFSYNGKTILAHRISYKLFKGKLDPNLTIDHLCRNRSCVNPEHLEQVSINENLKRGYSPMAINKRKTHCKRGHEFNKDNTYIFKNNRRCRVCDKLWRRKHNKIKNHYVNIL